MTEYTIYHNPRCSKSRQTLALLNERGIEPRVVEYLSSPPDAEQLAEILSLLDLSARGLLRKGEQEYRDLGLDDTGLTEADLIAAMVSHPRLLERPIVVHNGAAVLGRPPENVLDLIEV